MGRLGMGKACMHQNQIPRTPAQQQQGWALRRRWDRKNRKGHNVAHALQKPRPLCLFSVSGCLSLSLSPSARGEDEALATSVGDVPSQKLYHRRLRILIRRGRGVSVCVADPNSPSNGRRRRARRTCVRHSRTSLNASPSAADMCPSPFPNLPRLPSSSVLHTS